ncbi:threonylcarbamoyladenosine tRNA methylthiotransferase [Tachysurus ichikawai]
MRVFEDVGTSIELGSYHSGRVEINNALDLLDTLEMWKNVLVPKKLEFKGKMIKVDIFEAGKHFLRGRPVEESTVITPSISRPLEKGEISGLGQVSVS